MTSNDINNVIFEGYCWQIIRTTETGGVKLLYGSLANNNRCPTDYLAKSIGISRFSGENLNDSPAYVGYMWNKTSGTLREMLYDDDVNKYDSEVKSKVESWFSTSEINENKLEDAIFCNDRSLSSKSEYKSLDKIYTVPENASGQRIIFNAYTFAELACANQTDAFSTSNLKAKTNYKVGLISTPEALMVGRGVRNRYNNYWYISPIIFTISAHVNASRVGYIYEIGVSNENSTAIPSISLSNNVLLKSGTGSTTDPFIVE